jgi:hypothetical protein
MSVPTPVSGPGSEAEPRASVLTPGYPRPAPIRRAAGIYGLIVTAAVLATAGAHLGTMPLAVAVFVTLVVYWLAEEYAELGEHAIAGHLPTWAHVRTALAAKWPMVSASYVPLLALVGARVLGATPSNAALVGLGVTVVLLTAYGWAAGRASGLHGIPQLVMAATAGALGMLMIFLKIAIVHLH